MSRYIESGPPADGAVYPGEFSELFDESDYEDAETGFLEDDAYGEDALSYMPEELQAFPEWREAYAEGVTVYDAIREALGPEYETITDEEADEILEDAVADMSPEEIESFFKSLGRIASKALPAIGGAVGTMIAPGVGTAIGGALGGLAGKAVGSATRGRRRRRRPTRRRARRRSPRRAVARPSPRARRRPASTRMRAELMRLMQNPQFLQSLTGSILGGRGAVRAGETYQEVQLGAFLNALEHYAQEAAQEAHQEALDVAEIYETDDAGAFADAAARAETLMDMLDQTDA